MFGGGLFGMAQEAGIDPGIAERQGLAIDAHRAVLKRANQILGGVHQGVEIAAVVPALRLGSGDEDLQRRIAGARAHAGQRGVNPDRPALHRDDAVGDAERQVVVGMDPTLRPGFQHAIIGGQTRGVLIHGHRAAAVSDIDAVRAIGLHQLGLLGQGVGFGHMAHHQEARHVHTHVAGGLDVLLGDISLGAMGRDTHRPHAQIIGALQIMHGADARQQQGGEHAVLQHVGHRADPVPVGVGAEAVVEAGALQAVAVSDLDRIDLGAIQCSGDRLNMIEAILVADRVHAVTQGDVLNIELGGLGIEGHAAILAAIFSAVLSAAEVMMSRLPA